MGEIIVMRTEYQLQMSLIDELIQLIDGWMVFLCKLIILDN